jgi:hypothetical protein
MSRLAAPWAVGGAEHPRRYMFRPYVKLRESLGRIGGAARASGCYPAPPLKFG